MTKLPERTAKEYDRWIDATIEKVLGRLEQRIAHHRADPQGGRSAVTIEQQNAKFDYVEGLITRHRAIAGGGKKRSGLARIIRGFLVEFIRQSEEHVMGLNVSPPHDF